MIKERLKFYADTDIQKNKLFCWNVTILQVEEKLMEFMKKGWYIKSAWYEKIDTDTGEIENTRINDLQRIFDKVVQMSKKGKISP
jgi:hypothetical protein